MNKPKTPSGVIKDIEDQLQILQSSRLLEIYRLIDEVLEQARGEDKLKMAQVKILFEMYVRGLTHEETLKRKP